ncbi:hypothetical protein QUA16_07320 [Microcoleus sp. S13_C3]|uniref:hypothetical protein n=1 Tax=unclassified Microcoleus TaxID=2642155 RepID=UPI002FCF2E7B
MSRKGLVGDRSDFISFGDAGGRSFILVESRIVDRLVGRFGHGQKALDVERPLNS